MSEVVHHDEAEVGVGMERSGGGQLTGGGHPDLRSLLRVQQSGEVAGVGCGELGTGLLHLLDGRAVAGPG